MTRTRIRVNWAPADTHVLLWALDDDPSLSPAARAAITDGRNVVFVSAATAWRSPSRRRRAVRTGVVPVPPEVSHVSGPLAAPRLAQDQRRTVPSSSAPQPATANRCWPAAGLYQKLGVYRRTETLRSRTALEDRGQQGTAGVDKDSICHADAPQDEEPEQVRSPSWRHTRLAAARKQDRGDPE